MSSDVLSPPVVYVPCLLDEDGRASRIRVIELVDGGTALVAYSALDRFIDACGADQPWALVAYDEVARLREELGVREAYLDVPLPADFSADHGLPRER